MSGTVLNQLVTKGSITSIHFATVEATQGTIDPTQWTLTSEDFWLGAGGPGSASAFDFEFVAQPYTLTVTHGSTGAGNSVSVTITDSLISGGNAGAHSETVTFSPTGTSSTTAVATGLAAAINADTVLEAAGYSASRLGPNVSISPALGDVTNTVSATVTGAITETFKTPADSNGNPFAQIGVAAVGAGGIGSFSNYDILAWNVNNVLLGLPDGGGGYNQFLQVSGFNLASPTYPVTLGDTATLIVPCFTAGTRIATPSGEVPVERLQIGDLVLTPSGAAKPVKWLGRRSYGARAVAGSPAAQPVRIRAGALAEHTPTRDLFVSPQHALLIDGMLLPAAALVNDVSITRCRNYGDVSYIHIELDDHDAVLAEGAATETFVDCDSRAMFQNAAEYAALYPNETPREPCFCAPRIESGELLHTVFQRIAARAGLWHLATPAAPGPLQGHVERIAIEAGNLHLEGWVLDTANPKLPVRLEVLVGRKVVAELLANRYRADLEAAGLAGGRCAFDLSLPASVAETVTVRRMCDQAELPIAAQEPALAQAA